jgi:hypothetical protein
MLERLLRSLRRALKKFFRGWYESFKNGPGPAGTIGDLTHGVHPKNSQALNDRLMAVKFGLGPTGFVNPNLHTGPAKSKQKREAIKLQ